MSASRLSPAQIIATLGLEPHIEGGQFVQTYRSPLTLPAEALPAHYGGARAASTAIYYLFTPGGFSRMHRVSSDELFHFYLGDPLELLLLRPDGSSERRGLGTDLAAGERPQQLIPAGVWQGTRLKQGGRYALIGATVAPGFEYADYEGGEREALLAGWPLEREGIVALTPSSPDPLEPRFSTPR